MRERALQSRTLTDRRSITLPLCVLAAGAVHGLAVMALLPVMITLPGPGTGERATSHAVDVDVLPASIAAPPVVVPRDPETTAAIPDVEDQPVTAPAPDHGADGALADVEDPPMTALAPDHDAEDTGRDDESVPAESGLTAAPEARIEPATTVITPAAVTIPAPAVEPESEPAVSDHPAPAVAAPAAPEPLADAVEEDLAPEP